MPAFRRSVAGDCMRKRCFMGKVIGIDLGTTNSCVSVMAGGEPKVIANAEGVRTTRPGVSFAKSGQRRVGLLARPQAATRPHNTL